MYVCIIIYIVQNTDLRTHVGGLYTLTAPVWEMAVIWTTICPWCYFLGGGGVSFNFSTDIATRPEFYDTDSMQDVTWLQVGGR